MNKHSSFIHVIQKLILYKFILKDSALNLLNKQSAGLIREHTIQHTL